MQAFREVFHKTGKTANHKVLCTFAFQAPHHKAAAAPTPGRGITISRGPESFQGIHGGGRERNPRGAPQPEQAEASP